MFSEVKEDNFYANGVYRVDSQATETMLNSLMYRLCYYRYGEMYTRHGEAGGYDNVRNAVIGLKNFKLTHFEEAYTSERWLVRIYKVLPFAEMTPAYETKHPQASRTMPHVPKFRLPK